MNKKGFTLLEITIALGLLSLFLLITLSFTTKTDEKLLLEQSVHKLANDIRYAKEYARANNTGFHLDLDGRNRRYEVRRGDFVLLSEELPAEYSLTSGSHYINNLGRMPSNFTINVRNNEGHLGEIIIAAGGRVRVNIHD